jgi:hypothetical protein
VLRGGVGLAFAVALSAGAVSAATPPDGVQVDVSQAPGTQSETTIAIDPTNDQILLAGSNDHRARTTRAYSSTDGGATWASRPNPPLPRGFVFSGDPVVGIDRSGRQYFGFISVLGDEESITYRFFVSTRASASAAWSRPVRGVAPNPQAADDKPALAVDTFATSPYANRVYGAWARLTAAGFGIVLAHSDDGARHWSKPVRVSDRKKMFDSYPSIAVGGDGTVYVAWWNANGRGVFLDESRNGGASFGRDVLVDPIAGRSRCAPPGVRIPAQPTNCVRPNPIVSVDASTGPLAGRVYVSYGDTGGSQREQDVYVAVYDRTLYRIGRRVRVNPADGAIPSDQFWPASAVDSTTGKVWVCFYDTRGDPTRKRAFYTCTRSTDGGLTWAPPVHAASVASNETRGGANTGVFRGGREYGDYEGLAATNGVAHPVWTDSRRMRVFREEVYTTTLSDASFGP